ncbi:MAG: single-stranded DNA-binding protein [Oscillospiraceae bacterium]|jgi:single-strand DNA-binding protein|nr:single-stranded DNA-binding protein [Oscillospiraceae bacterium]
MNHIVLMGRLTRDPELRHTQNGTPVASFSLAVDRRFAPKDGGERQTDFVDIVAWQNTAEFVSRYFVKGQMAAVTGRLQIRDWTDKDGNKRRSAEVVADNIYFTESKKSREASFGPAETKVDFDTSYETPVTGSDFAELDMDEGELPF